MYNPVKKRTISVVLTSLCLLALISGIGAYFSDLWRKRNEFRPGENDTRIQEVTNYPDTLGDEPFQKQVMVKNDSNVKCYIRVYVGFSENDALNESYFSYQSPDENADPAQDDPKIANFYSANPNAEDSYADRLKSGWNYDAESKIYTYDEAIKKNNSWFYCAEDGYYYYTLAVEPEDETLPLFTQVQTIYGENEKKSYDIIVYSESVQIYDADGNEVEDEINGDAIVKPAFIKAFYKK